MGLYERWCDSTKEKDKRTHYWTYVEKYGGRDEIRNELAGTIRSHVDAGIKFTSYQALFRKSTDQGKIVISQGILKAQVLPKIGN